VAGNSDIQKAISGCNAFFMHRVGLQGDGCILPNKKVGYRTYEIRAHQIGRLGGTLAAPGRVQDRQDMQDVSYLRVAF
jgi:hypothetical protein